MSLGMVIKTADRFNTFSFNEIISIPHAHNNDSTTFITILTDAHKQLILTPTHLIPKCDHSDVTAAELYIGDCLFTVDGKESIVDIYTSVKNGVYTVVTNNTYIIVNDVIVSPFSINNYLISKLIISKNK
tara:strand:+ start:479 stop:868 length:390 start_codon:yes stop_codon:yes gene_type:complete